MINYFSDTVRNSARNRHHQHQNQIQHQQQQSQLNMSQSAIPPYMRNQQQSPRNNQSNTTGVNHQQQILDHHDENLSDKEIFPGKI